MRAFGGTQQDKTDAASLQVRLLLGVVIVPECPHGGGDQE